MLQGQGTWRKSSILLLGFSGKYHDISELGNLVCAIAICTALSLPLQLHGLCGIPASEKHA